MELPGFAAEASLYASRDRYRSRVFVHAQGQVIPQLSVGCAIKAGLGYLKCAGGPLDPDTCARFAMIEYGVCDLLEIPL